MVCEIPHLSVPTCLLRLMSDICLLVWPPTVKKKEINNKKVRVVFILVEKHNLFVYIENKTGNITLFDK